MKISPSIFKAYDIRGVVPSTLNTETARQVGRAFGTVARHAGEQKIAVGRDGRLSSPELAKALIDGLTQVGIDVIDIGMVTTPMLYFASHTHARSGIQVTGSHNPKDHNGFKMVLAQKAIYGEEIQQLYKLIEADQWDTSIKPGSVEQINIFEEYKKRICSDIHLTRKMKIVVDAGNGVAGASAPEILRGIGCEVQELFSTVDGNFPNHHPDPSKPENLKDLITALKSSDAEIGLAFDGDGDRLGIVTKDGQNIFADRQIMLFARDILKRQPGGEIIYDVKCTQQLAPYIKENGGQPIMYKTGHSLIKARMRETNAPLGGEMSGHLFFKERWYGFDDGTYAACRLLEILSHYQDPSAELNALPQSFSTPEVNIACEEGEPHTLVKELVARAHFPAPATINTIDGLRVDWPDGFGLVRASNTTPVLVLRFEGKTQKALERIKEAFTHLIHSVKPNAKFDHAAH